MMKRVACFLCALILFFGVVPLACSAAELELDHPCSLTLTYTHGGEAFSDLNIEIYRVAELDADGDYTLLKPFSTYPIKVHNVSSQKEWQEIAQTIKSYAVANKLTPYRSQKTNDEGIVSFTGLETGLYMVKGVIAENVRETVVFHDFMMYLPSPAENAYDYDVEAKPKCTAYTQHERYTVVKLWNDEGASAHRPQSVSVDIWKDGEFYKNISLSRENSWSYSWNSEDKDGVWNVIEKDVPDGYEVSITKNETVFIITNTKSPDIPDEPDEPDEPENPEKPGKPTNPEKPAPETGNTFPMLRCVTILCISGFGMITLSALGLRERRYEEKQ